MTNETFERANILMDKIKELKEAYQDIETMEVTIRDIIQHRPKQNSVNIAVGNNKLVININRFKEFLEAEKDFCKKEIKKIKNDFNEL